MSLDGYLDDASSDRLILSSAADLDRVDELRAGSDAILIGAGTIRADNPRLLLRSPARREARGSSEMLGTVVSKSSFSYRRYAPYVWESAESMAHL